MCFQDDTTPTIDHTPSTLFSRSDTVASDQRELPKSSQECEQFHVSDSEPNSVQESTSDERWSSESIRTRTEVIFHTNEQSANSDSSDPTPSTMNPSDHTDPTQPGSDSQVRSVLAVSRLSPESYSTFKDHLDHVPEMNLPWQSLRSVRQCTCGVAFSFATRKVICMQ